MRHIAALLIAALLLFAPAFGASAAVTRAQFVQTLWEQWGSVAYWDTGVFSDVGHGESYTHAICWAYDMGFTRGVGDGLFEPERPITREEAAIFLRRAARHIGRDTENFLSTAECNDFEGISPWADDSLYWATATGLMEWAEGGLRAPAGTLSPEEATAIFDRFQ